MKGGVKGGVENGVGNRQMAVILSSRGAIFRASESRVGQGRRKVSLGVSRK